MTDKLTKNEAINLVDKKIIIVNGITHVHPSNIDHFVETPINRMAAVWWHVFIRAEFNIFFFSISISCHFIVMAVVSSAPNIYFDESRNWPIIVISLCFGIFHRFRLLSAFVLFLRRDENGTFFCSAE